VAASELPGGNVETVQVAALALPHPHLQIRADNGRVTLLWDQTATGYVLERSSGPGADGPWTPVEAAAVSEGSDLKVTLPLDHAAEFFRLSRQQAAR